MAGFFDIFYSTTFGISTIYFIFLLFFAFFIATSYIGWRMIGRHTVDSAKYQGEQARLILESTKQQNAISKIQLDENRVLRQTNLGIKTSEQMSTMQQIQLDNDRFLKQTELNVIALEQSIELNEMQLHLTKLQQQEADLSIKVSKVSSLDHALQWYKSSTESSKLSAENLSRMLFDAYTKKAEDYYKKGKFDMAILEYNKALTHDPDHYLCYHYIGMAHFRKGEMDKSIENYVKAKEMNPNDPDVLNNLGLALEKNDLIERAIEEYEEALKVHPHHKHAQNNLKRLQKEQNTPT